MTIEVIDLTNQLENDQFSWGRGGANVKCVMLHDTSGPDSNPDRNNLPNVDYAARERGTLNWFLRHGPVSIGYFIGPEATGAKIYRLCADSNTAWHAAGNPVRNVFVAKDGFRAVGRINGVSAINAVSIGIERWGVPGEDISKLPLQKAALIALVVYLCRQHNLDPEAVISHRFVQGDRFDGELFLMDCRAAVARMRAGTGEISLPGAGAGGSGGTGGTGTIPPAHGAPQSQYFVETGGWVVDEVQSPLTGQPVRIDFLRRWRELGNWRQNGFPISGVQPYRTDGAGRVTMLAQWFERARFEFDLLTGTFTLGRVGAELLELLNSNSLANLPAAAPVTETVLNEPN